MHRFRRTCFFYAIQHLSRVDFRGFGLFCSRAADLLRGGLAGGAVTTPLEHTRHAGKALPRTSRSTASVSQFLRCERPGDDRIDVLVAQDTCPRPQGG